MPVHNTLILPFTPSAYTLNFFMFSILPTQLSRRTGVGCWTLRQDNC